MKVKELLEKITNDVIIYDIRGWTGSEEELVKNEVLEKFGERDVRRFFLDYSDIDVLTLRILVEGDLFD